MTMNMTSKKTLLVTPAGCGLGLITYHEDGSVADMYMPKEQRFDVEQVHVIIPDGSFVPIEELVQAYCEQNELATCDDVVLPIPSANNSPHPLPNNVIIFPH